jgi:hypothetical protein
MRKRSAGYFRRLAHKLRKVYEREPPTSLDSRTERARAVDALQRMNQARLGGKRRGWRW